jgi:hypothetical protein
MISSQSDARYREEYAPSGNYPNELHSSPDLAPLEELLEVRPGVSRSKARRVSPSGNRRSIGSEVLRLFVFGLIIATIGGAAFASQYGDDNIKETLGILQSSVSALLPEVDTSPSATIPEGSSKSSDRVSPQDKTSAENTSAKETRFTQSSPASVTAASPPQVQQQLAAMAGELAIVRGLAEQLTASQKKMAQDIAALETAKENLSQKMWWLYQSSAFDAPPHKTAKKTVPATAVPATAKSPPVPNPAPHPQTP